MSYVLMRGYLLWRRCTAVISWRWMKTGPSMTGTGMLPTDNLFFGRTAVLEPGTGGSSLVAVFGPSETKFVSGGSRNFERGVHKIFGSRITMFDPFFNLLWLPPFEILSSILVYGDTHRMKSKKISNDQELIQYDPTSCPQNQKGNN